MVATGMWNKEVWVAGMAVEGMARDMVAEDWDKERNR
jgi:hypothetical protein